MPTIRQEGGGLWTERLNLVPLSPSHAPALHPLLSDFEVVRMFPDLPRPITLEHVIARAERQLLSDRRVDEFAILRDGAPIGACTVKWPGSGSPPRPMPRLGYWIGRQYWGNGYATEALGAVVEYAFGRFPEDRVGAGVFTDNPASRRVLEKLGFRRAGGYSLYCISRDAELEAEDVHLSRTAWEERRR